MRRLFWIGLIGIALAPSTARAQEVVVYYHTDAIGSVRAMTDETGVVIHRYDFLPFGEAWDEPSNADTRQFAGKERDRETGLDLDYFGARYHLPLIGRFTTVDPVLPIDDALVDPQRWNRYSYVGNRPLTLIDPDGRNWVALLHNVANRLAASPASQQAQKFVATQGTRAWVALTRLFNTPAGQDATQAAAELATGGSAGPSVAHSAAAGAKLTRQLASQEIAGGHAFAKHVVERGEFPGIKTVKQFAERSRTSWKKARSASWAVAGQPFGVTEWL
jgi:RHS repeat-associated protein